MKEREEEEKGEREMEKESSVEAARTVLDRWNAFSVLWKREGEGKEGRDGEIDHPNGWSNDDPSP